MNEENSVDRLEKLTAKLDKADPQDVKELLAILVEVAEHAPDLKLVMEQLEQATGQLMTALNADAADWRNAISRLEARIKEIESKISVAAQALAAQWSTEE